MRRWGLVVAICYGLVVAVLVVPAWIAIADRSMAWAGPNIAGYLQTFAPWIVAAAAAACQALLLFLSVDTSFRRLRPRRHLAVTIALTSLLTAVLLVAGVASFDEAVNENAAISNVTKIVISPYLWPAQWLIWAVLFYIHARGASQPVAKAVDWLLKGSVMEILIAVPSHVIARQRDTCCAGATTSLGICTGLAVMLFAFGPGVLALYKKRLDAYRKSDPRGS